MPSGRDDSFGHSSILNIARVGLPVQAHHMPRAIMSLNEMKIIFQSSNLNESLSNFFNLMCHPKPKSKWV
ncbi:hypothetical protein QQP08_016570 [Theobroma cacao]|nr:hypothetical protein QQP08_016570 [Theobroma cacao]